MNIKKQTRRLLHFFTVIAAVAILLGSMPDLTGEAASGMLDTTFGNSGKVITAVSNLEDNATSTVIQPDSKIIAAGGSGTIENLDFALVRYNTDGSLDNSFGTGGKVITAVGNADDGANAVILQPDGKIIAAGVSGSFASYDFALVRYTTNGTLDSSFGTGGKVITPIGSGNDEARAVVLQSDGKIVAVGLSGNFPNIDFALVRYNTNGTLDTSFGTGGKVLTSIGAADDEAHSVIIQTDGKIVAAGFGNTATSGTDFALVRYNTDGSLDNSFGTGGKVTTPIGFGGDIRKIALQADGKIVAAGYTSTGPTFDVALVRYNPNGTLDVGFGTNGKVITAIGSSDEIANAVLIQPNGKIIAVGWSDQSTIDFALVRYNSNGTPDNSFGTNGIVLTPIGNSTDFGFAAALQTDGKIVVTGSSYNGANFDFSLARYTNNANISIRSPFDFDGDSKTDISIFRPAPAEWWYLRSSDGGNRAFQFGASSDKLVPADFTGDGKTDCAFWRPSTGFWFVLRSENNSFYSFPFGANGDVPAPGDYDGDGKTDAAIFRPSSTNWFIQRSTAGILIQQFGIAGDFPTPNSFVP